MLELWLIRHGETDWNCLRRWQGQTDIPLNGRGMEQAGRLARRLHGLQFDGVYASDLGRTRMTASLAMPSARPILDRRLREMDFGTFEGKSWDDMSVEDQAVVDTWWQDPYHSRLPGAESFHDLERRLVAWRGELPPTGRFLVFTHGGPIRSLLWEVLGAPRNRSWTIMLNNCGLTRISYENDRVTIITANDCSHLEEPRPPADAPTFDEAPAQ